MNDKTREQIEAMKNQTIGVEIEMNNITREKAARKVAEYFGTRAWNAASEYGYYSWACKDQQGRVWKFQRENKNMTYTKISLYLANGIPEALSNLWYGSDSAVVEIRDAVEDAKNGKDLLNRIQKMKLLRKFTLDRETEKRIRFKGTDCWGNVSYLEIIR
jgi:hypothetical protein